MYPGPGGGAPGGERIALHENERYREKITQKLIEKFLISLMKLEEKYFVNVCTKFLRFFFFKISL